MGADLPFQLVGGHVRDVGEGADLILLFILRDLADKLRQPLLPAEDDEAVGRRVDLEVEVVAHVAEEVDGDQLEEHHPHEGEEVLEVAAVGEVKPHDRQLGVGDAVGQEGGDGRRVDDLPGLFDPDREAAVDFEHRDADDREADEGDRRCPARPQQFRLGQREQPVKDQEQHQHQQDFKQAQDCNLQCLRDRFYHVESSKLQEISVGRALLSG